MADIPGSKDKSLEALDFIINVLREHERNLDKSINELAKVNEQIANMDALSDKLEKVEEKIDNLQKEVRSLIGYLSKTPRETFPAAIKAQEPQILAVSAVSPVAQQSAVSVILHCKRWEDFQVLAMLGQTVSFSYKEDERIFQVDTLKGNQIVTYVGALPNFSLILKKWLSRQLNITEQNILEGFLDKPK